MKIKCICLSHKYFSENHVLLLQQMELILVEEAFFFFNTKHKLF